MKKSFHKSVYENFSCEEKCGKRHDAFEIAYKMVWDKHFCILLFNANLNRNLWNAWVSGENVTQLKEFQNHPRLHLCSSWISTIVNIGQAVAYFSVQNTHTLCMYQLRTGNDGQNVNPMSFLWVTHDKKILLSNKFKQMNDKKVYYLQPNQNKNFHSAFISYKSTLNRLTRNRVPICP